MNDTISITLSCFCHSD